MVKIQKLPNGQLVITIPKRLAELKEWDKGTNLIFREHDVDSFILAVKKEAKEAGDESARGKKPVKRA